MSVCFIKSNYNSVFIIIAGGLSSTSLYKLRNKIGRRGPVNQAKVEVGARAFFRVRDSYSRFSKWSFGLRAIYRPLTHCYTLIIQDHMPVSLFHFAKTLHSTHLLSHPLSS